MANFFIGLKLCVNCQKRKINLMQNRLCALHRKYLFDCACIAKNTSSQVANFFGQAK